MPAQFTVKRPIIIPIGPSIAYVPLTQGYYALIDREDAELLGRWNWCATDRRSVGAGIRAVRLVCNGHWTKPRHRFLHTELMNTPKGMVIDHANRNPLDNRRANLRVCTQLENNRNRSCLSNGYGKSGVPGVHGRGPGKWRVVIRDENGVRREVGSSSSLETAIAIRSRYP